MKLIKVFLICSGLGHVNRGIESFTQECFDILSDVSSLDVTLFKGGGETVGNDITLWNLRRGDWLTSQAAKVIKLVSDKRSSPTFTEQSSFFLSLIPHIYFGKPEVIYFSQSTLGTLLWHWRHLTGQHYKLLFRNGGPTGAFDNLRLRWDHTQQLAPLHLQDALKAEVPAEKQSLLPNAIHISPQLQMLPVDEQTALRQHLGLPEQRPLVLSVAAINRSHKRMDYVIREISNLPEPRPFLLLLGQRDGESSAIEQLGYELLGENGFQIRTVGKQAVPDYYKAADIFVLASLHEGLPRVCLEAMAHGLPCLVHYYETTQYIFGEDGYLANLEMAGNLTKSLNQALIESSDHSKRYRRHQRVYDHFSWDRLCPEYVKLIENCAQLQPGSFETHYRSA